MALPKPPLPSVTPGRQRMLFHEGDPAEYVYNVTRGAMKLYKLLPDGRRQVTGFLLAGDFLGLAGMDGYSYSAETVTAAELCRFPRCKLDELFKAFPQLQHRVLKLATAELIAQRSLTEIELADADRLVEFAEG